jgi:hypothetical protein
VWDLGTQGAWTVTTESQMEAVEGKEACRLDVSAQRLSDMPGPWVWRQ